MKKYGFITLIMCIFICACTSTETVSVVKGSKNTGYPSNKVIHISESTIGTNPSVVEKNSN